MNNDVLKGLWKSPLVYKKKTTPVPLFYILIVQYNPQQLTIDIKMSLMKSVITVYRFCSQQCDVPEMGQTYQTGPENVTKVLTIFAKCFC
jgi:hypothetical protein